jgi:hypothetical protein
MSICVVDRCIADADSVLVVSGSEEATRTAPICPRHRHVIGGGARWAWEPTSPGCGRVILGAAVATPRTHRAAEPAVRSA